MRTLNFSILFVYLNFNKFPSSDFRVQWNARNSEKRTRKFRLPSILERGISPTWPTTQNSGVVLVPTVYLSYVLMSSFILGLQLILHPHHAYSYHVPSGYTNTMYIMRPPQTHVERNLKRSTATSPYGKFNKLNSLHISRSSSDDKQRLVLFNEWKWNKFLWKKNNEYIENSNTNAAAEYIRCHKNQTASHCKSKRCH